MTTAIVLATAGSASAARNLCPQAQAIQTTGTSSSTAHFVVHYASAGSDVPSPADLTTLKNDLEAGYDLETNPSRLNFPAPANDGDGKTDVYVYTDAGCPATPGGDPNPCGCNGFMFPDTSGNTGWLYVKTGAVANHSTGPHEFFHLIQLGMSPNVLDHSMLREASASWIGAIASNTDGGHPPIWQRSSGIGQSLDYPDSRDELQYGDWPFFEYESERFTPAVIKETFAQATAPGAQTTWMNNALTARSASLGQAVTDYANQVVAADWPLALLRGQFPLFQSNAILGVTTNTSTTQTAALDHLTTRFFKLQSNACQGQCEATLHLDLGWPDGSGVQAALVKLGSSPGERQSLSNGSTGAHADLPFNLGTQYGVAITNPSLTADSVPVSLSANATTPPTAPTTTTTTKPPTTPPPPVAPVSDIPTIQLTLKPKVSRSGRSRVMRFTLASSNVGFVTVVLTKGKAKLVASAAAKATTFKRTVAIKQGTFSYRVPISERVPKGSYTVTLTPRAAGGAAGTPISAGKVSVPKLPKAKKKAKRTRYVV